MAFTVSNIFNSAFGDQRVVLQDVTTDSAENTWATPLLRITGYIRCGQSGATDSTAAIFPPTAINAGTTGTVNAGYMAMTSCVSGATYRYLIFGAS